MENLKSFRWKETVVFQKKSQFIKAQKGQIFSESSYLILPPAQLRLLKDPAVPADLSA